MDEETPSLEELLSKHPVEISRAIDKFLSEQRLIHFIEAFWQFVEPGRPFVNSWCIEAVCEHLEAVSSGEIKRLLINIFPGAMKSLASNVFWPAWEWGPLNLPTERFLSVSYSQSLTIRDNVRFRQVISSDLYKALWGERFGSSKEQYNLIKVGNNKTGWKIASSVGGAVTGERGSRVVLDDPNSVAEAESDAILDSTKRWFLEVLPSRLQDLRTDAIVVIQQRTSERDVSGVILENGLDYVHLMVPMFYEPSRHCSTSIGWQDPRGLDDEGYPLVGEDLERQLDALAFPERFPLKEVRDLEKTMGPYAANGQLQQRPAPRGGGIFKREWWNAFPPEDWPIPKDRSERPPQPKYSYIVAALDTAMTEKEENDYSALSVWGVWHSRENPKIPPRLVEDANGMLRMTDNDQPKAMLIHAWQKRLHLYGPPEYKPDNMTEIQWNDPLMIAERQRTWGLMEWIIHTCKKYKVDNLLIEDKAAGHTVHQEMARLNVNQMWSTQLVDPRNQDKVARAYSIQHLFSNGIIYGPQVYDWTEKMWRFPSWCEAIIDEMAAFPKAAHDDATDAAVYALRHLRDIGVLMRRDEAEMAFTDENMFRGRTAPLYDL